MSGTRYAGKTLRACGFTLLDSEYPGNCQGFRSDYLARRTNRACWGLRREKSCECHCRKAGCSIARSRKCVWFHRLWSPGMGRPAFFLRFSPWCLHPIVYEIRPRARCKSLAGYLSTRSRASDSEGRKLISLPGSASNATCALRIAPRRLKSTPSQSELKDTRQYPAGFFRSTS